MELGSLSLTELRRLQSKVETEIRRRSDTARRDLIKRMQKMAAEQGLSLDDVLGGAPIEKPASKQGKSPKVAKPKKTAKVSVIKYRNPANPDQGWSGRGRKPQWVHDWLAQGKPIEELAA